MTQHYTNHLRDHLVVSELKDITNPNAETPNILLRLSDPELANRMADQYAKMWPMSRIAVYSISYIGGEGTK